MYPGVNVNECQELCEITQNCLYFVYGIDTNKCYLKYGLADEDQSWGPSYVSKTGHKYSTGKFIK